jgi:trimeric autotransporter adhesin
VFQRRGADWRQQAYVKAFNSGSGDGFGHGLALSSDGLRLFSGAPGESSSGGGWNPIQDNNSIRSGAVYLY